MKRPRSVASTGSHPQVLQTLAWLEKNGFKAVPLHKQSKAALSRAYVSTTYDPPKADHWRSNDHGIGIVTGPLNGGPVDFDLDCEEAVFFAPYFLPGTNAVFGRSGKRRSHYLFRVAATSFEKVALSDPATRGTIVEARGDGGHQTVLPGSIHESSGELVEWDSVAFPDVIELDPDDISKALRKIAIATLLVRYAWGPGTHNETTKNLAGLLFYLEWPLEETEQLITALMEFDDDTDKSRIPTVRATYRRGEAGKKIAGAGVFRKQINNDPVVDKILEWAGSSTVNLLQEYNDRYACVMLGNKFRIADFNVKVSHPPQFYAKEDWLEYTSTDKMDIEDEDGKTKKVSKSRVWLASERRRKYDRVDFMPGDEESSTILNLWTGWAVTPDPKASCTAYLELLKDVICGGDEETYIWILHWLANIVRDPMNRLGTALAIIGREGVGKSISMRYFGKILGAGYNVISDSSHLYGQFNKHLANTLLLNSEEAVYGGNKDHAAKIRDLITGETMRMEPKGVDVTSVRNYMRIVFLSNAEHAVPVAMGDRRYTVINMKERRAPADLIKRVVQEEFEGNGPAALFHYLTTMPYDSELARTNVKNESLAEMKSHNFTPVDEWWHSVLSSGVMLPDKLSWACHPEKESWPSIVATPALHAAMQVYCRNQGARFIPTSIAFGMYLNKVLGFNLTKTQRSYDNADLEPIGTPQPWLQLNSRMATATNFPTLAECRKSFEAYVSQPLDWPTDEPDPTPKFMKKDKPSHDKY